MNKTLFLIVGLVFGLQVSAQRFGIVDSEMILNKIPEYGQAQQQLNQLSTNWQGEVEALYSELDALKQAYNAEKVLLTEEMQKEKLKEIADKEKEAKELQRKYFGPEGDVFKKRQELIRPIQDQIYSAVQDVARRRKLDVVFDKSSALITLYNNGKSDISDEVLEKMGYN
ncbi:OmpH family outer membrane protein [Owenweeksia hongkongensis]|uniref:Outer membrane protein n=1 Tax=Owenweeksia hongkongensis (strain DSM 17368 / CIP 108786 / JCM 12287 / NRRL B-23963 / UST20020801) TaxID=926562 RepID=G8R072_OWEHD|nr:OmpH family outer membrane protein [Owenweeksia hongkongensis]AEV33738.1 outer membrane protein [Owenweeksia hongkongensis DSM 17368]